MNHAITIGGLLLSLILVGGLGAVGIGGLMILAGGMSDAPSEGDAAGRQGCTLAITGLVVAGAAIGLLVL
jgi:hypothetical protein